MSTAVYEVTIDDIRAAAQRIVRVAHRTPIMTCATIDALAGRKIVFKCENMQRVGAFKFRGAYNAVSALPNDVAQRGVVTHSSGNHAQALALAAKLRGITAHIVMPRTASAVKMRAVEGYGGNITFCDSSDESRESTAAEIVRQTGGTLIPPFDHPHIIAGQGTAAVELIEQADTLDAIITPVGGGGLLSGTCIAARAINDELVVFAGEPEEADDAARSMATGVRQPAVSPPRSIADGLLTGLSETTWSIICAHVREIITVSEAEIIAAMRLVWERMKIVIEPSAAVPVAAVLNERFRAIEGLPRVGVIISGGNVDLDRLPWMR